MRLPSRVMRKRVGQFGSGQATSASVLIQSFGWVARCLAGNSGNSAASEYIEKPCPGGKCSISPRTSNESPTFALQWIVAPGGAITSTRRS